MLPEAQSVYAFVTCLYVDMVSSTENLLKLKEYERARFYRALVRQIEPHITALGLSDAVVKFTGDGWLIMVHNPADVEALLCLGLLFSRRFRTEMAGMTGRPAADIPALRIAAGFGRDLQVSTPPGQRDWVGDSARRAARLADCCFDDEFLVSQQLVDSTHLDFTFEFVDLSARPPERRPKHSEEDVAAVRLTGIRGVVSSTSDAPYTYVYTLGVLGDTPTAERIAVAASAAIVSQVSMSEGDAGSAPAENIAIEQLRESLYQLIRSVPAWDVALRLFDGLPDDVRLTTGAFNALLKRADDWTSIQWVVQKMNDNGVLADDITYTVMINKARDYVQAVDVFRSMERAGVPPTTYTFTTLVAKAPTYQTARKWVDMMKAGGFEPNVVTLTAVMAKAPNYKTAVRVFKEMRALNIEPNEFAYSILIRQSPDYRHALDWLRKLRDTGHEADVVAYTAVMSKAPSYSEAQEWYREIQHAGMVPDVVTYATLMWRSPSYQSARIWLDEMDANGIVPNDYVFTCLMKKAATFELARAVLGEMLERDIRPTVFFCNGLIGRTITFEDAAEILRLMGRHGVRPNEFTYKLLVQRAPTLAEALEFVEAMRVYHLRITRHTLEPLFERFAPGWPASELLAWFRQLPPFPQPLALDVAIQSYMKANLLQDALALALEYPHLKTARIVMRNHPVEAVEYFRRAVHERHPDGDYALGVALVEAGRIDEAKGPLLRAIASTTLDKRRGHISSLLDSFPRPAGDGVSSRYH